jgi:hypothetical protein
MAGSAPADDDRSTRSPEDDVMSKLPWIKGSA